MSTLKFSQFTTLATVSPTTTFFVGYDGSDNSRFLVSAIQLQDLGGQLDASTQLIGTINTGGSTSITLGTYITFTGGDLNLSFGQYIRWDGNIGITMNNINNMELNAGSVLDVVATGAVDMPTGTNAQRPTGQNGMLRFNTDINEFEGYKSNAWYTLPDGNTTNTSLSLQSTSPYTLTLTDSSGGTVDVSLLPVANSGVISIDGADGVVTLVEGTGIEITTDTNFNTIEIATTVSNTTYLLESAAVGSNVDINLNASGSGVDSSLTLVAGGNVTLTESAGEITIAASGGAAGVTTFNTLSGDVTVSAGSNITLTPSGQDIEISSTDTNTVYTYTAEQVGSDVNLTLNNITDATTDSVKVVAGTNITLTESSDEITIDAADTNTTYDLSSAQSGSDVDITLDASTGTDTNIKLVAGTGIGLTDNGSNEITIDATSSGVTELNGGTGAFSIIGGGVDSNQQILINTNLSVDPRTIQIVPVQYQLVLNSSTLEFKNEGSGQVLDSINLGAIINEYEFIVADTSEGAELELAVVGGQTASTLEVIAGTDIGITGTTDAITISYTGSATGTVTSVDTSNGTFIDVTGGAITTTGTITADLSATGTPSASNFLRGDNSWAVPPNDNDNTTYTISQALATDDLTITLDASGSDPDSNIVLKAGSNVDFTSVTGGIEISSTDTDTTYTLSFDTNTDILTLTDGTTPQDVDLSSLAGGGGLQSLNGLGPADGAVFIAGGTGISLSDNGDDIVTVSCTVTDTTYSLGFNSGTDVLTLTPSTGSPTNINLSSLVGVETLNGNSGAVTISAGTNVTLTEVGNDIEISATGGSGSVGTLQQVTEQGNSTTEIVDFDNVVNFNSTSHIKLTSGTEAQRPTGAAGYFRYNTDSERPEIFNSAWRPLGMFNIVDTVTVDNAKLSFPVPSIEDSLYIQGERIGSNVSVRISGDSSSSAAGHLDRIYLNSREFVMSSGRIVANGVIGSANLAPPSVTFEARGTDGIRVPSGSEALRPNTELAGIIRYNTTTDEYEGNTSVGQWVSLSAGSSTPTLQDVLSAASTASVATTTSITTSGVMAFTGSTLSLTGNSGVTLSATTTGASINLDISSAGSSGFIKLTGFETGGRELTETQAERLIAINSSGKVGTLKTRLFATQLDTTTSGSGSVIVSLSNADADSPVTVTIQDTTATPTPMVAIITSYTSQAFCTVTIYDMSGNTVNSTDVVLNIMYMRDYS